MLINLKYKIPVAVLAVIVAVVVAALFVPASFPSRSVGTDVEFRVAKGESLGDIADALKEQGLIKSTLLFKVYTTLIGQNRNLKAGTYTLSYSMSVSDLVRVFSGGLSNSDDIVVTIPEGSNINDLDIIFAKAGLTKSGDFLERIVMGQEGQLFPDTYRFVKNTTKEVILEKLSDNFSVKSSFLWDGSSEEELHKIITIASLLEKEVQTKEDMAIVSGIIQNRLNADMLLQIDATVAYGVCRKSFLAGRRCEVTQVNLTEAIKKDDPYNTYKVKGLPPGPISNPGIKAIYAALHPAKTDYFYYLTDLSGKVYYGRTAAEHAANRAKYLNK